MLQSKACPIGPAISMGLYVTRNARSAFADFISATMVHFISYFMSSGLYIFALLFLAFPLYCTPLTSLDSNTYIKTPVVSPESSV